MIFHSLQCILLSTCTTVLSPNLYSPSVDNENPSPHICKQNQLLKKLDLGVQKHNIQNCYNSSSTMGITKRYLAPDCKTSLLLRIAHLKICMKKLYTAYNVQVFIQYITKSLCSILGQIIWPETCWSSLASRDSY